MLKILFAGLLLANAGLFAYQQGYLETLLPSGHEPGRLGNQFNADKIKLLPAGSATAAPQPPAVSAVQEEPVLEPVLAAAAARNREALSCTEIGNFEPADAKRFETRLAALSLGERLSRRNAQEGTRHMVYIPSQTDKEGAEKKAGELRRLGIKDFYVIQESGELHWGISLGIFKTEEAARSHLATLSQQGVRSARLGVHRTPSNKVAFQLRSLDASAKSTLDKIKADFPGQEMRACEAARSDA